MGFTPFPIFIFTSLLLLRVHGASLTNEENGRKEEVVTEYVTVTSVPPNQSHDDELIIKYPVTPEPDEVPPTTPSPEDLIDDGSQIRMTEQQLVTGEADCSKFSFLLSVPHNFTSSLCKWVTICIKFLYCSYSFFNFSLWTADNKNRWRRKRND